MVPWVDFDIVEWILRVLEGWELGNKGSYRKYRSYKITKISKFYFGPGVRKTDFYDFSKKFHEKNPEYGNLEWDDGSGNLE